MVRRVQRVTEEDPRRKRKGRESDQRIRQRAEELAESGIPFQMAMAVAQGRLTLNDALERLAQKAKVESLMGQHELSRALATQIIIGHAKLEAVLAKRRLKEHRDANLLRSCLDEAASEGEELVVGLHGQRTVRGKISEATPYGFTVTPSKGEPEEVHKLQVKYAYRPSEWKRVKKALRQDAALTKAPLEPIPRPQDRYTCSDKRLFRCMDQEIEVQVTLLEGEQFRGLLFWFGRYEFGLKVKGDVPVWIFRHAMHGLDVSNP
jgi:sRNA-binding regulator protein Hfq